MPPTPSIATPKHELKDAEMSQSHNNDAIANAEEKTVKDNTTANTATTNPKRKRVRKSRKQKLEEELAGLREEAED